MEIKYIDTLDNEINQQQASILGRYIKRYIESGVIKKDEYYSDGDFILLTHYKTNNETHQEILNIELDGKTMVIREFENFGMYKLEKDFYYDESGVNTALSNVLYDPNNNQVGAEMSNGGIVAYENTIKEYYDLDVNPEDPIFICSYDNGGTLINIDAPNEHLDPDGQEREVYLNQPDHIAILMAITGITQELMDYYMSPDVTPNF